MKTPTAQQIRAARQESELTQEQAAGLVYKTERQWQNYEGGVLLIPPGTWELFNLKRRMPALPREGGE